MEDGVDKVIEVICTVGRVSGIGPDDDFYEAGFSSIHALELLLEIEDKFGVSIPDDQFIGARTARGLHGVVSRRAEVPT